MSDSEDRRIAVPEAATHHWGRDVAVTLMEMLPPSGWGDVATRQQLDALRDEMHREFALVRAEMRADRAELRAEVADTQRRTLQWMISTIIATTTLSTAIITLVR